jgi:hypothetical protein
MRIPLLSRIRKMEPSLATLLLVTVGAIAVVGLLMAITAPTGVLIGETQWRVISAFHGMGATAFLLSATIAVYLAWRLYAGEIRAFKDLKWLTAFAAVMSGVTIVFGTWIYIAYRAPGGPRTYFLGNMPEVHQIFFEFKEFIAMFTLPMFVTAAYILWKYDRSLLGHREARAVPSLLILLGYTFLLVAYVLGAAITKLAGV